MKCKIWIALRLSFIVDRNNTCILLDKKMSCIKFLQNLPVRNPRDTCSGVFTGGKECWEFIPSKTSF